MVTSFELQAIYQVPDWVGADAYLTGVGVLTTYF